MSDPNDFREGARLVTGRALSTPSGGLVCCHWCLPHMQIRRVICGAWRPGSQENPPVDNYDCAK